METRAKPMGWHRTVLNALIMTTAMAGTAADIAERNSIGDPYKWDLSVMYSSASAWNNHYQEVDAMVGRLAALKGTVGQGTKPLLQALELRDQINVQLEKLHAYAAMKHDEDMRAQEPQAVLQRAETLVVKYEEQTSWFNPELLQIPEPTLDPWLEQDGLGGYRHFFQNLFRTKKHILSPREEALLAMSSKATAAAGDAFSLLTNTELRWRTVKDSEGKEVLVSSPVYYQALQSKDRRYRRDAFQALHESFLDVRNTLAATLAGTLHQDWFRAKARHYESSLEASLDAENLPVSVYHNLVQTVNRHLPLLHRYIALRKKTLQLDEIHFYDLYVNLVDVPEKTFTYEEGRQLVLEGIQPFGPEYAKVMKQAFDSRWIDVFENKGKKSGAYNMGTYLAPPFVLMNFKETFNDVSTLAHELGHAMQSYFAKENQPPVYSGYPMFTAEVASTAAEIVFKQSMLERSTDPRQRAYLINQMLEDMRQTVFRQTLFSEFDLAAHQLAEKGDPLTAEVLMKLSHEINRKYHGPDLVMDAALDVECLRIPHYYRNYYVYRYATSYCAAAAIARRILDKKPQAIEDWMKFLKTGNSKYALDMLKLAGVDMTSPQPIGDAMSLFETLLGQLETLLAEKKP